MKKESKLFDYDIKKLNQYLKENYIESNKKIFNLDDNIQIKCLDNKRNNALTQFISKTFTVYNHIKTIIECLKDENNAVEDIPLNNNNQSQLSISNDLNKYSAFLLKKTFSLQESVLNFQKEKLKIALGIITRKKFFKFLNEDYLKRISILENNNLNLQINPTNTIKKVFEIFNECNVIKAGIENSKEKISNVIRSEEKIRTRDDRDEEGIFIY